jgi:hypothetical protein
MNNHRNRSAAAKAARQFARALPDVVDARISGADVCVLKWNPATRSNCWVVLGTVEAIATAAELAKAAA